MIIELGGNDGLRAYPIKQMRNNLAAMTDASLAQGAKVLLLAAEAPPNLGRRYTTLFRESYSQLANGDNVVASPLLSRAFSYPANSCRAIERIRTLQRNHCYSTWSGQR